MTATHWVKSERCQALIRGQTEVDCENEFKLLTGLFDRFSEGFDAIPQGGQRSPNCARGATQSDPEYVQDYDLLRHIWVLHSIVDSAKTRL